MLPSPARPRISLASLTHALRSSPSQFSHLVQRAYNRPSRSLTINSPSRKVRASVSRASVHATNIAARRHAEIGSAISADQKVNLRQILNDLRDLQALDKLSKNAGKSKFSDIGE